MDPVRGGFLGAGWLVTTRTADSLHQASNAELTAVGARDADRAASVNPTRAYASYQEVIADPKGCKLPTSPAALNIMAFGAMQRIDRSNISKWFEYLKRTPKELQSVFCLSTSRHPEKKQILMTSGSFVTWMRENQYLF